MALMITVTMKTDVATSEGMHAMLPAPGYPRPPGLMLHSAYKDEGRVKTVEVWASAEVQQRLSSSPGMVAGLAGEGHPPCRRREDHPPDHRRHPLRFSAVVIAPRNPLRHQDRCALLPDVGAARRAIASDYSSTLRKTRKCPRRPTSTIGASGGDGARDPAASRTASANASRSSLLGRSASGSGVSRTISHPTGAVIRLA